MAGNQTLDITTGCDLQEVDNAVNQASKELQQRYDFRNVTFSIDFSRKENTITLLAPDDMKLRALWEVLQMKLLRRQVPAKNLHPADPERAAGNTLRQVISLQQGIPGDTAKKICKFIKDNKLKKVQAQIQQDQVRLQSPSRDALQEAMGLLKAEDFGIALQFGNFRTI